MRWKKNIEYILLYLASKGLAFLADNNLIIFVTYTKAISLKLLIVYYDGITHKHLPMSNRSRGQHDGRMRSLSLLWKWEFIELWWECVESHSCKGRRKAFIITSDWCYSWYLPSTCVIPIYNSPQRYSISTFNIKERFIECIGGEQVAEMLITSLRNHNISLDDCNGKGFDNGCNSPEK